jgi:SAM-dependent methyltransferase
MTNPWVAGLTPERATALRAGFDADAEAYQRTRPVCPDELFDDLVQLAGLVPGDRIVEIAPGTGQATVPLAERGLAVTAVELGPSLAALARQRLRRFPAVEVVTGAFEDWQPPAGTRYRAVTVFNALHWIAAEAKYAKPAALLAPGSAFAVVSTQWARPVAAAPFWTQVQEDYQAVGFAGSPPPPPGQVGPWHFPPGTGFTETASLRYPFERAYSAADYLAQLSTQSGTRELGPDRAAEFLGRVGRRLDSLGSPGLTVTFVACLTVGIRN